MRPPLTESVWPVMKSASSDAKNATAVAMSSGMANRFIGTARFTPFPLIGEDPLSLELELTGSHDELPY